MISLKALVSFLALSPVALAAPQPNYTDLCYTDITNIDTNVKALTEKIKGYNGGLVWALPQIPLALQAAVATASGGVHSSLLPPVLPVDDLLRLADHVNKTLAVDSPVAVEALVNKASLYEQAGLKTPIHLALKVMMALHLHFADNILDRVSADAPADKVNILKGDIQGFTNALRKAIKAFE
ncbi:hypothetical protein ED733_003848 [Metarhizium rileyi]|uniref:Cell wall galactomannoprotein n=1 Tax=Metarhizium rileyi (strain RCEF 4871) TaxID=1649241 RepID=A0A5C6G8Y4_METRR|nr:hypothetical protein ED733_003848 [Metarhizium rileyi]